MSDVKEGKFILDRQKLIDELIVANNKEKSVLEVFVGSVALIFLIVLAAYTGHDGASNKIIGLSLAIFVGIFFAFIVFLKYSGE